MNISGAFLLWDDCVAFALLYRRLFSEDLSTPGLGVHSPGANSAGVAEERLLLFTEIHSPESTPGRGVNSPGAHSAGVAEE